MHWYDAEIDALVERIEKGEIQKGANLFYGSSSFRLWNTLAEDFSPYKVANVAFGGSTLEACAHFFERVVVPCEPSTLFIYAGDNDLGDGKYYLDVIGCFETLLRRRAKTMPQTPFYFLSIKPSPARRYLIPQIRLFNAYVRDRLSALPNCTYIDVHNLMLDQYGMTDPWLYDEDGLHMNAAGYALWRDTLLNQADFLFR